MKFYVFYDVEGEIGARQDGPYNTYAEAVDCMNDLKTFDDTSNVYIKEISDEGPKPLMS